ncbi:MAG: protoheme IX farnesyltransferase [Chthoniobacterales bacterium]|nr:protoheme IX farnesyltransferase [Chthoniobacterales bacterium]
MNNFVTEEKLPAFVATMARFSRALFDLTKPKIAIASVLTILVTYVSLVRDISLPSVLMLLLGSGLAAGGSLAFNQWWERDSDLLMRRTRFRPLPQKALSSGAALTYSLALSLAGCLLLWGVFGVLTAGLGLATILIYAGLYTPMKCRSRWATEVGSISGALPPILGAAAAGHANATSAWLLALALFFWQMPHFYAIGWIHRDDYRAAGLPLLPAVDLQGRRTGLWMLVYSGLLVLVLLLPWSIGLIPPLSAAAALTGAMLLFIRSWKFYFAAADDRTSAARRLFHASLLALPGLLFLAFA